MAGSVVMEQHRDIFEFLTKNGVLLRIDSRCRVLHSSTPDIFAERHFGQRGRVLDDSFFSGIDHNGFGD